MNHGPGTIVIPVADAMRFPEFFIDYSALDVPNGTTASVSRSASVVQNMNMSLRDMPPDHDWAFILGDDHVFPSDLLRTLLDHEADVIVPLCAKRTPPYQLVIYKEGTDHYDNRTSRMYPGYIPYAPDEVPDEVFPVLAAGSAGMLIRRHVLEAVGEPFFESSDGVYLNEDLEFCRKVRDCGFEILCDPHAYLGHIAQVHVWPYRHEGFDGKLCIKLDCGGPPGRNEVFIGPPVEQKEPVSA